MRITVSKKGFLVFLFMFSCIPPLYLTQFTILKFLLNVVQVVGVYYLMIYSFRKRTITQFFGMLLFYSVILIMVTIVGNGNIVPCAICIFNYIGLPMLLLSGVMAYDSLIKYLYRYMWIVCLANLISLLIGVFALGNDADDCLIITNSNSLTPYLVVAGVLAIFNYEIINTKKAKFWMIALFVSLTVTEWIVWSGTGIVSWFVFLVGLLWVIIFKKRQFNFYVTSLIYIIFSLILTVFQMQNSIIGDIAVNLLEKDTTFSGRVYIWSAAIEKIKRSWIVGYGYGELTLGNYFAHNQILEFLVSGGFVLLFTFVAIVLVTVKQKNRFSAADINILLSNVLKVAIFSLEIQMITEVVDYDVLFFVLSLYTLFVKTTDIYSAKSS